MLTINKSEVLAVLKALVAVLNFVIGLLSGGS